MTECQCRPWNHQEGNVACLGVSTARWGFSICLATAFPRLTLAPALRSSQNEEGFKMSWCWLECLLNEKNETKMEWTLCRWILVKDASRGCDSVINLIKLQTEKLLQQNQRLLTANVHSRPDSSQHWRRKLHTDGNACTHLNKDILP